MSDYYWLFTKYTVTAAIIVFVSEVAKRSDKLGGLIAALPIMTLLTLIWLHFENQSYEKIANHASYTFWYVIPTLPFFILFPLVLKYFNFWIALTISIALTILSFIAFNFLTKKFEINLF